MKQRIGIIGGGLSGLSAAAHLLLSAASKRVIADLEAFSLRFENLLAEGAIASGGGRTAGAAPGTGDGEA